MATNSGRDPGRLADLRVTREVDGAEVRVSGLVCGGPGVLERVGLRLPRPIFVAWGRVLRIEGERIAARDDAGSRGERLRGAR